jgi:HEAT repeat protein
MRRTLILWAGLCAAAALPAAAQGIVFLGERVERFEPPQDLSGASLPALERTLQTGTSDARLSAAWYMGLLEERPARQQAMAALLPVFMGDEDATVQRFAGQALERILKPDDLDTAAARDAWLDRLLGRVAQPGEETLRGQAAALAGFMHHPRATPVLLTALDDESLQVRTRAATALGMCGSPAAFKPLRMKRDALPAESSERFFYEDAMQRLTRRMERLAAGSSTNDKGKKKK